MTDEEYVDRMPEYCAKELILSYIEFSAFKGVKMEIIMGNNKTYEILIPLHNCRDLSDGLLQYVFKYS